MMLFTTSSITRDIINNNSTYSSELQLTIVQSKSHTKSVRAVGKESVAVGDELVMSALVWLSWFN